MPSFIKHFVQVSPGVWTCVSDGEYRGPAGRMQVTAGTTVIKGKTFMGVDLAAMLEREAQIQSGYADQIHPGE